MLTTFANKFCNEEAPVHRSDEVLFNDRKNLQETSELSRASPEFRPASKSLNTMLNKFLKPAKVIPTPMTPSSAKMTSSKHT